MKKRVLSIFMCMAMVFSMLPTVARAASTAIEIVNVNASGEECAATDNGWAGLGVKITGAQNDVLSITVVQKSVLDAYENDNGAPYDYAANGAVGINDALSAVGGAPLLNQENGTQITAANGIVIVPFSGASDSDTVVAWAYDGASGSTAAVQGTVTLAGGKVTTPFTFTYGTDLPAMKVGVEISEIDVSTGASGGTGSYTFSATGLPAGLSIDEDTGIISGTPTAYVAASANTGITVSAADNGGTPIDATIGHGGVAKGDQTLTRTDSGDSVVFDGVKTVTVSSNASGDASYKAQFSSSDTGVAEIGADSGVVTTKGVGTTIITASSGVTENYAAASDVTFTLTVTAAAGTPPTVTLENATDEGFDLTVTNGAKYVVSTTTSMTVAQIDAAGPSTSNGSKQTITGKNPQETYYVHAYQPAAGNYAASDVATESIATNTRKLTAPAVVLAEDSGNDGGLTVTVTDGANTAANVDKYVVEFFEGSSSKGTIDIDKTAKAGAKPAATDGTTFPVPGTNYTAKVHAVVSTAGTAAGYTNSDKSTESGAAPAGKVAYPTDVFTVTGNTHVYTGSAQTAIVTSSISNTLGGTPVVTYSGDTNVDEHDIKVTTPGGSVYKALAETTLTEKLSITPAALTIVDSSATFDDATYTGSKTLGAPTSGSVTVKGLGSDVGTATAVYTVPSADVGAAQAITATVSAFSMTVGTDSNYELPTIKALTLADTMSFTPATVTLTAGMLAGLSASKVAGAPGNAALAMTDTEISTGVNSEHLTLKLKASQTAALNDDNVGTGKTYSVAAANFDIADGTTATIGKAANYTLTGTASMSNGEVTATAPLAGSWTNGDKTYDKSAATVTFTPTANDAGTITHTYYTDSACTTKTTTANSGASAEGGAPVNAGTYYAQATAANSAYGKSAKCTIVISKATLTTTVTAEKVYDGDTTLTAANLNGGADVMLTGVAGEGFKLDTINAVFNAIDVHTAQNLDVTSFTVKEPVSSANAANYKLDTLVVKGSIIQAELSSTTLTASKTYDGTDAIAFTNLGASQVLEGVNGEQLELTGIAGAKYTATNVHGSAPISVKGTITAADKNGAKVSNYDLTKLDNLTINGAITRAPLTATKSSSKDLTDTTAVKLTDVAVIGGVVNNEDANTILATGWSYDAATGTYKNTANTVTAVFYEKTATDTYALVTTVLALDKTYYVDVTLPAGDYGNYNLAAGLTAQGHAPSSDADVANFVTLNLKNSPPPPSGGGGVSSYTVTYDVGEHGALAEGAAKTEKVNHNKIPNAPAIVAAAGYKFMGWSVDGKTVLDMTKEKVTKAVTYKAVYAAYDHKPYMVGIGEGVFAPTGTLTRAEAVTMLARLTPGFAEGTAYTNDFIDAQDGWYSGYIGFATANGIAFGVGDGLFQPMRTITRGEFAAMLARFMGLEPATDLSACPFSDCAGHWTEGYILALHQAGVMDGLADGTVQPDRSITREEAAKMVNVAIGRTPSKEQMDKTISEYTNPYGDVSVDLWSFYHIMEASVKHVSSDFHGEN